MGLDKDKIQEICQEVGKAFAKHYAIGFTIALVNKIKDDINAGEEEEPKLMRRAAGSEFPEPHSGMMKKKGDVNPLSWKDRFFSVKKDWTINYYAKEGKEVKGDSEAELKKDKKARIGNVNLYGYTVRRWSSENTINAGVDDKWAIECYHYRKRKWVFICDSEESYEKWKDTLTACSRNTPPPHNPDPVLHEAFMNAYKGTRKERRLWGWWSCDESYPAMIATIIYEEAYRVTIREAIDAVSGPGFIKWRARAAIKKAAENMIATAVAPVWASCEKVVETLKPKIEEGFKAATGPFFEAEKKVREKLVEIVTGVIEPATDALFTPIIEKVFIGGLCKPLHTAHLYIPPAFNEYIEGFHSALEKKETVSVADLTQTLKDEQYHFRWSLWWWEPTRKIYKELDNMRQRLSALGKVCDLIECMDDIMNPWSTFYEYKDEMRQLLKDAAYTHEHHLLQAITADTPASEVLAKSKEIYATVTVALAADQKVLATRQKKDKLFAMIYNPLNQFVQPKIEDAVKPIDDMIPEPVKLFLSVAGTLEDALSGIVENVVDNALTDGQAEEFAALDAEFAKLGISAPPAAAAAATPAPAATDEKSGDKSDGDDSDDDK